MSGRMVDFPCGSKYKHDNETVEGIQPCLEAEALHDAEFHGTHEEAPSPRTDPPADYPSGEIRDADGGPKAGPSGDATTFREYVPTEIYDELESAKKENAELRYQLEFPLPATMPTASPLTSSAMTSRKPPDHHTAHRKHGGMW